jgi:hypothetical protein
MFCRCLEKEDEQQDDDYQQDNSATDVHVLTPFAESETAGLRFNGSGL